MPTPDVIVCTGPESSGKSTLAKDFAKASSAVGLVPEYARTYLDTLQGRYVKDDLFMIAAQQENAIGEARHKFEVVLADTDVLTILIWMEDKFGEWNKDLYEIWKNARNERCYLLCKPDIPWQPDPQREDPHRRELLFNRHLELLLEAHAQFHVLEGSPIVRLQQARDISGI